jgi:hypothetical protein
MLFPQAPVPTGLARTEFDLLARSELPLFELYRSLVVAFPSPLSKPRGLVLVPNRHNRGYLNNMSFLDLLEYLVSLV